MDRSIKVLLTVIAILLVGLLLRPVAQTPAAHADGNNPHGALSTVMVPGNGRPDAYVTVLKDNEIYLYSIDTLNRRLDREDRKVLGAK